jgi:hypothetical protein
LLEKETIFPFFGLKNRKRTQIADYRLVAFIGGRNEWPRFARYVVSALNRATMSATRTTKQREDGIPTCSEYARCIRVLFAICGYVPAVCVQDEYSSLHNYSARDLGMKPNRISHFLN